MCRLQGEHATTSSKPIATLKLLFDGSLVCSSFVVDADFTQTVQAATYQGTHKQQLQSGKWFLRNGTVFSLKNVHMYRNILEKII